MKKALLTTILLCTVALTAAAQTIVVPTCRNHGLKGPVHIVQSAYYYETDDGYVIGGSIVEVFDPAGRLQYKLDMSQDGHDEDVYYTYDAMGRLVSETYPAGEPYTDTYHYASDGRLVSIVRKFVEDFSDYGDTMTVLRYDRQGRPAEVRTNGQIEYYQYWPNGEIKQKGNSASGFYVYYNVNGQQDSTIDLDYKYCMYYNQNGDLVADDLNTGTVHFRDEYVYDYIDEHGNWLTRTIIASDGVKAFSRRKIIYYE